MLEEIYSVPTPDGEMDVHVFSPHTDTVRPAVIIYQEAFGVNNHIKDVCRRFAAEGYIAAAPELFHRSGEDVIFDYNDYEKAAPVLKELTNRGILDDTTAMLELFSGLSNVDTDHIFAAGFCMGGFAAMLAASHFQFKAVASFYGGGMVKARPGMKREPILEDLQELKSPSILFFGEKDQGITKEDVEVLKTTLEKQDEKFQIVVYDEADHGFFCNERKTYNAKAAKDAWVKTLQWFETEV